MAGYHQAEIERGTYGEISKILEEAAELKDAMMNGNKIMALLEMSDMIGAIEGYLEKYYQKNITLTHLCIMANATRSAFEQGHRK